MGSAATGGTPASPESPLGSRGGPAAVDVERRTLFCAPCSPRGEAQVPGGRDQIRLIVAPDPIDRVAIDFVAECRAAVAHRQRFAVALAGGQTPRALYGRLSNTPIRDQVPWPSVEVFLGDERAVPPDHPESNWRMAYEELLGRVPIPPGNLHRPVGEHPDAGSAADGYSRVLASRLPHAPNGVPVFDLVLLGMGEDGHTASLFPGTAALDVENRWCVANWVEALGVWRLTVTFPVLRAARQVWVLVTGENKAEQLAQVLSGGGESLPIGRLVYWDHVTWYADLSAARYTRLGSAATGAHVK